ncbi:hypothetical protein C8J57DRAFT_1293255, partial [Mycena rebaudengoi]
MWPGPALTPNVVLVPRTNIAVWVRALGCLCIVVTGARLKISTHRRLQMCLSPRASFSARRVPPISVLCCLPRASRCVSSPRAGVGGRRRDRVVGRSVVWLGILLRHRKCGSQAEQKEERGGRWRWDIRAETSRSWQSSRHVAGVGDISVERQWWAKARWRRAT